ncbi:uncharacterized protein PRCAT00000713001 [Priceomyces carsonii]|uniref:uncharacterized protein n=1 Tax=Priceomyces carsonii TaxID=28549 RepID=UPI002EDA8103|nr:unnamed protein product [Priceomyces carsonii]
MSDDFKFNSTPSGRHQGKTHIVIVGAGIIGVCTAFYLIQDPDYDPSQYHITLLESARVAGGASGKAGGMLARWAFPKEVAPLSFQLHNELAESYDGEANWGFRHLPAISIEADVSNSPEGYEDKKDSNSEPKKSSVQDYLNQKIPSDLDWLNRSLIQDITTLGKKEVTAQVHPYKFTKFLLKKALEDSKGSLELILGKVERVSYLDVSSANGIFYTPKGKSEEIELTGDQIIMTAGPWTSRILPSCPIGGMRAHSITIDPYEDKQVSGYAVFTELQTGPRSFSSPEIYARPDEVYVSGEGDNSKELPETSDDVEVVESKCDNIFKTVGKISPNLRKGRLTRKQACYLPILNVPQISGPIIGETNVSNLFVAAGHSCWGINNAPATGKLMSEILLRGRAESSSIKKLSPALYFDAEK